MILIAKAKTKDSNWIYGYPVKENNKCYILQNQKKILIQEDTICYHLGAFDKNNTAVFTNDIINDFGGGVRMPDPNSNNPDFPDYIVVGDDNRLGEVIIVDGTVRIRTKELSYAYNISDASKFSDTEVVGNAFDKY